MISICIYDKSNRWHHLPDKACGCATCVQQPQQIVQAGASRLQNMAPPRQNNPPVTTLGAVAVELFLL